ncbi:MAG: tungstate ABC transporter substrate-binding protein WtpA [Chloroflexi bacterium HGW-Chloroflexi-3]|nr:MAG: tungstate ABC transporter substrate-binding protein WtpA [Chloroflexi bacterium HGW-Chloroflexi-3]
MQTKNRLLPLYLFVLVGMLASACQPKLSIPETLVAPTTKPSLTATEKVEKIPLVVFAAGSLIIPFAEIETAFEAKYPEIDVLAEYHGSIQVMRHVTELHEPIDIVATADAALVPMLMYATTNPDTGQPYADWFIRFAGNKLALAYTPGSLYAQELTSENWPEILSRTDVRYGLPDPRFDAAGYRAMMAFALHENSIQQYDLFKAMYKGQFSFPVTIFREEGHALIRIPEILETKSDAHILIRGASVFLIALMESSDLDYAFEYESVVKQHGLEMLELPSEVNLGTEKMRDFYKNVEVRMDFQRFSTVDPHFIAEPIEYAITIPDSSPNPEAAELFIQFLLGEEGKAIMSKNYHLLLESFPANGFENMPTALQIISHPEE